MKCEECLKFDSSVLCKECDQALCAACDELLHKGGKRKTHFRPGICQLCKAQASLHCSDCNCHACKQCEFSHSSHRIRAIVSIKKLGVFWDISSTRPNRPDDIPMLVSEIQQKLGNPEFFKCYGDTWGKWKDSLSQSNILSVHKTGIKTYEALLLDISLSPSSGLTHILIISNQTSSFTPHLIQLKSNFPAVDIYTSTSILPLQITEILNEQPIKEKNYYPDLILNYLKEQAFKGNVIIEFKEFAQVISLRIGLGTEEISKFIDQAEAAKIIFVSFKEFDRVKTKFISLKVEKCSLEVLTWTLRSLCVDEMLPSEKAIQARMREVFDLKPGQGEWQHLMDQAKGHSHSSSAPEFSLFSWSPSLPKFVFEKIYEQSSGTHTVLIYPAGEKWHALDHDSKSGDYLNIKQTPDWKEFLKFLEEYFKPKNRLKKDQEQKSIPGGRYGCAQFLKLLGPIGLRKCSLGRLSYMVQLAINDTYLRYDRTLILWTSNTQGSLPKEEVSKKLQILKSTILSILSKCEEGVSLAQLPMHLKKAVKFSYNLSDLGFAKLKDLLATIPEVSIELRNANHPFAVLTKVLNPILPETLNSTLLTIMTKFNNAAECTKIESALYERLGKIDWKTFKVNSLADFIEVYSSDKFQVHPVQDSYMIFKAKSPEFPYFYEPYRVDSCDFTNERTFSPVSNHRYSTSIESYEPWYSTKPFEITTSRGEEEPVNFSEICDKTSSDFSFFSTDNRNVKPVGRSSAKNQSEDLTAKMYHFHGHNGSWVDSFSFKPPGFE